MFQPVANELDFPSMERRILQFWEDIDAFQKLRSRLKDSEKRYSFIDGPITANGDMGVHHAWGRTYKDLFQRYKAMSGFNQRWQNGFDCQGLWVEVGVEKELGFSSKRDIEHYGIGEFVQRCKERVLKFARIQTEQSIRLGYWQDWADSYYTMSDENNYTIWRVLKECNDRGWLYRGHDVMPWCPRCGTGISQHEIDTEGYRDVTHTSLYVRFPLVDAPSEALVVWTTTPWTLTSNVAAAVHPDYTYVRAEKDGESVILVEPLAVKLLGPEWEIVQRFPGSDLVGRAYRGPFDELGAVVGVQHRVIPWTEVSQEDGTGIVHIAPGCGEEDFVLGKEFGLPAIAPLDENGYYLPGFDWLTGQSVRDVQPEIERSVREKGLLFRSSPFVHRYPHCWRCDTELVFRLVDEWYIKVDELRPLMAGVTRQIRWLPDFGLDRELDWLQNMHDWMISKKRYWGLALPIWSCEDCGHFEVIGGWQELKEKAAAGWERFEGRSPHRPYVDAIKITCSGCGRPISRIPDVGNPWLDAGIVPFATLHYGQDRAYWEQWFPADFITESFPGQYRNWFYSLLVMSTVLENRPPFRAVLGFGTLRGEDGRPMHKSWGNAIEFNQAADTAGADVMRWIFCTQNPAANLNFGFGLASETKRRLLKLWDSYKFFILYARLENWTPGRPAPPMAERHVMDRWVYARLQSLVASVRERLDDWDCMAASRAIEDFVEELSNWYIRRSRSRFWGTADGADPGAMATLHHALVTVCHLLAPFMPFLAEEMYQNLVRSVDRGAPESVHHSAFPEADFAHHDASLVQQMERVRVVARLGNSVRKRIGLNLRRPLLSIRVADGSSHPITAEVLAELQDELNVKRVELTQDLGEIMQRRVETNPKLLGPKYGKHYPRIRQALQSGQFAVDSAGAVHVEGLVLEPDEAAVTWEPAPGHAAATERGVTILLDTTQTPELVAEGRAREIVRLVQDARKQAGFEVQDRIELNVGAPPEMDAVFAQFGSFIQRETLAIQLTHDNNGGDGWHLAADSVDGLPLTFRVRRTS